MKIYAKLIDETGKHFDPICIDEPDSYQSIFQEKYVAFFHDEADKKYREILDDITKASECFGYPRFLNVSDTYDEHKRSLEQVRQWLMEYDEDIC